MLAVRQSLTHKLPCFYYPLSSSCRVLRQYSQEAHQPDHRASARLFQDAQNEEAELAEQAARAQRLAAHLNKEEHWTGDERMEDAVLRMLVDKYKPLRNGPIRTAEEKLRQAPPRVAAQDPVDMALDPSPLARTAEETVVRTSWGGSGQSLADVPLLPSIEGHQPWHTTFKVPSHAQSSIKYGNIPPPKVTRTPPASALDDKARRKEREAKRRAETVGRLQNARESMIDYKLGLKGQQAGQGVQMRRPVPVTLKGWASLVEERIEACLVLRVCE